MTVQELIAELRNYDPKMQVHFSYNYGDHWRTQVAPAVESVDEYQVKHSGYHNMDVLVDEDSEDDEAPTVVVLQAS